MYQQFYQFSEKPFNTTPDSKFFFPSPKHTEALNNLIYAINERKGFVVITGEIGVGKTTVWRTLLNKLEPNTKVATITNTHLTSKELIAEVLEELEVDYKRGTKQKLLSQLNKYLIQQLAADMNVVLIIDEAQNLPPKVLEEVRMLSNLETEREKLIQIILIGQPQLKSKLEHPRLEQFRQRIAVYYHMSGLSRNQTQDYIFHRLRLVSANGLDIFTPKAIDLIYSYSSGIPRLINLVCDSALLSGYIYDTKKITEKIINEVIKERDFNNIPEEEIVAMKPEEVKIHCCPDCQKFDKCETKWLRGTKGEEQICCQSCQDFARCIENAKRVNLN
ncbi:MAG: AAA family ATPase [Candidatus Omnitrophota bacterium]